MSHSHSVALPVTSDSPVTSIDAKTRLKKAEVCKMLGVSPRTLDNLVMRREFPEGVRIGKWSYWTAKAIERFHERAFAAQENWTPMQAATQSRGRRRH